MRHLILISLLLLSVAAGAQKVVPQEHDLGRVKLYNNPTLQFTFSNTSNKRLLFLPVSYQRDLMIEVPQGYISPGESVKIKVTYYTESSGRFSVHQPLYISTQNEPIYLNITGKIISFHPSALSVCPQMNKSAAQTQRELSSVPTITTYDSMTGMTISGVNIIITSSTQRMLMEKTKKPMVSLGEVPIGLYSVEVSKQGYRTAEKVLYIRKGAGNFIIELSPIENYKPEQSKDVWEDVEGGEDSILIVEEIEPTEEEAIDRIRKMVRERYKDRNIVERDVMVVTKENSPDTDTTNLFDLPDDEIEEEVVTDEEEVVIVQEDKPREDYSYEKPTSEEEDIAAVDTIPDFTDDGKLSLKYARNNIVFLIDVSSSMRSDDKLPMLKESMKSMVEVLRPEDQVTIITYASKNKVLVRSASGNDKARLNAVIDSLYALGYSRGAEGMAMAYNVAIEEFIDKGNNQVILATDGLFNSKDITNDDLYELAESKALQERVRISVVAFGKNDQAIEFLNTLSGHGGGSFIQIKSDTEAKEALVQEIMRNALIR